MKEPIIKSATKLVLIGITLAIIALAFLQIEVWEPLSTIAVMVFSFYFGQKSLPPNQ